MDDSVSAGALVTEYETSVLRSQGLGIGPDSGFRVAVCKNGFMKLVLRLIKMVWIQATVVYRKRNSRTEVRPLSHRKVEVSQLG